MSTRARYGVGEGVWTWSNGCVKTGLALTFLANVAAAAPIDPPPAGSAPAPAQTAAAPSPAPPPARAEAASPEASADRTPETQPAEPTTPAEQTAMKRVVKEAVEEYFDEKKREREEWSKRRHDGIYVRIGINVGYAIDRAEDSGVRMESNGFGGFLGFAFGVNVGDRLVFAFAHDMVGVFSPSTTVDGVDFDVDHSAFYHVGGFALDYYPDPEDGLHFGGTIGPGVADVQVLESESTDAGFGLVFGGGYDLWIADQWSLGLAARVMYIAGAADDFGDHRVWLPMLSVSALFH